MTIHSASLNKAGQKGSQGQILVSADMPSIAYPDKVKYYLRNTTEISNNPLLATLFSSMLCKLETEPGADTILKVLPSGSEVPLEGSTETQDGLDFSCPEEEAEKILKLRNGLRNMEKKAFLNMSMRKGQNIDKPAAALVASLARLLSSTGRPSHSTPGGAPGPEATRSERLRYMLETYHLDEEKPKRKRQ